MPVPRKPCCAIRRGAACPSILVVLRRSSIVQQSQTSHAPHLTFRQTIHVGVCAQSRTKRRDSAPELGTMPPHCLRAHDTSTRTDRQTRLFSCLAVRPLKTRYADPLDCWTQDVAGQGREADPMHINRPVVMQMGQMGPNGSNNASMASCPSLLLLDLAVSQPRKSVDAHSAWFLWLAVIYTHLVIISTDGSGKGRLAVPGQAMPDW